MKTWLASMAVALALTGMAWSQDGERREKGKDGKGAQEPALTLGSVDTNGDGKASVTEIRVAIARLAAIKEGKKYVQDNKEKGKEGGEGGGERKNTQEPAVTLKGLDANNDGRATTTELQAALDLLTGKKEGGEKKEGGNREK